MKKLMIFLILFLCIACSKSTPDAQPTEEVLLEKEYNDTSFAGEAWYDLVEVFEIHREPARASFFSYATVEEALQKEASSLDEIDGFSSEFVQSLNGEWDFYFAQNPNERLKDIKGSDAFYYWENWDTSDWDKCIIPSNVQTQVDEAKEFKYESPHYVNQVYPWISYEHIAYGWQGQPVAPTSNNSVAHYKRSFTLDEGLIDKNVFVSLQGVESAFYLYINGQQIGYSEDSYTPAEFNITPYLKEGENTIALEVYRWSDASYFENQDFIRLSGVFRDVYLYSKDDLEIRDFFFTSTLDENYKNANANVEIDIRNLSDEIQNGYQLKVNLYNQTENTKVIQEKSVNVDEIIDSKLFEVDFEVESVLLWSAEKPNLYRLTIELLDEQGNTVEAMCQRIGFREIELSQTDDGYSQVLLNGNPLFLKGVNRHETDLVDGRAINKEDIITDLTLMKAYNINAFRMSHYPNQTITYDIADEIGLYIVDEANIETHIGENELNVPSNNPIYAPLILDRTISMVERDKNHSSVLFWSLGNESTYSEYAMDENYPFYQSTMWILKRDPSRMRVYERDNRITEERDSSMVDVYSTQYWSITDVEKYAKDNTWAYFQSEYAHAMGNGLGNLKEYYDLFRSYSHLQGGFIWDFIDQSILTTEDGIEFYGYGGDWEEPIHDGDFCGNGLVNADRTPSAELEEVKYVQQNFLFELNNSELTVTNENLFTNLNEYEVIVSYIENGIAVDSESMEIDCNPLMTTRLDIPNFSVDTKENAVVEVSVHYKEEQIWANETYGKKGDEVAFEQFVLSEKVMEIPELTSGELTVNHDEKQLEVSNLNFTVSFNQENAMIEKFMFNDYPIISDSLKFNFYRPEVSNDPEFSNEVIEASSGLVVDDMNIKEANGLVLVEFIGTLAGFDTNATILYEIDSLGKIKVSMNAKVPSISKVQEIAKVGVQFAVDQAFTEFGYYGKGPYENYPDRNTGSKLGYYTQKIDEQVNDQLLKPQDTGNKTEVSELTLHSENVELEIFLSEKVNIKLNYYDDLDVRNADHWKEIVVQDNPIVSIDVMTRGLGNASYGPGPIEEYLIEQNKDYTIQFMFIPKLK